jgi:hypothetical protein
VAQCAGVVRTPRICWKPMNPKTHLPSSSSAASRAGGARVAADASAKARPLRVNVPKSKARALSREFGLDSVSLTADEADKRRVDLAALVSLGQERGYVTQQGKQPAMAS